MPETRRNRGLCVALVVGLLLPAGCLEKVPDAAVDHGALSAESGSTTADVADALGTPMIVIAGGSMTMGNDAGRDDEAPSRVVQVSPFVIDKYEVTQALFAKLQLPNPAHFKGERRPVEQVRWSDAALACNERSRAAGLEPCYDELTFACDFEASGYRLPTEAEWEFAARAGKPAVAAAEHSVAELENAACYAGNSSSQTQPVGSRRPNDWGLHDMLGNVAEWCHDVYQADYYATGAAVDPRGPEDGPKRVIRGGSWKSNSDDCRATARRADDPGISDACFARDTYGFRCVRRPSSNELAEIGVLPSEAVSPPTSRR